MKTSNEEVLQIQCTTFPYMSRIVYILAPMKISCEATMEWAHYCHGNVAVIYGLDWDNCLTPWPCLISEKNKTEFGGEAAQFLHQLQTQVFPTIERAIGLPKSLERNLVGVSLSGLFALWAWIYDPGYFHNIASVSGSLWYPNFVEWVQNSELKDVNGRACFSLGKKEKNSSNLLFSTVADSTSQILSILKSANITCTMDWNEGGHMAPLEPRIENVVHQMFN